MRDYDYDDRTIGRILADKADQCGDRPFLRFDDRVISYAQLDEMTNRYANGFAGLGVGAGDHVAMLLPNCPEFLFTLWGLGKLGAVAVPVNTAAKGEQLSYFLAQSDSTVVVTDESLIERVEGALPGAPGISRVIVYDEYALYDEHVDTSDWAAAVPASCEVSALREFDSASPAPVPGADQVKASDPHLIMYTSGTTGPSKGALCPHSQGLAVGRQMALLNGYRPDDILYTCLPVFHGNALWYTVYAALWAEASVALYPHFSASRFWAQVRESGATVFNCLGAMANIIWQQPPSPQDKDHQVRIAMMVPTSRALADGFRERYGITVTSVYAMTENCAITVFGPDEPPAKANAAGRVRDYMSVQVVDDDGRELAAGETGEIRIRPNERGIIMHGYYKMGDATTTATRDLWFATGDRGHLDSDGYLYFADRKKEAIRRRGENISAYEVETLLCRHPAVLEAAAVPVPSELGEDDVMAYVVLTPEAAVTYAELIEFCAGQMAYYMVPRYLRFIGELPKTPSEKVEKYKLKLAAAESRAELWDREREGIDVRR